MPKQGKGIRCQYDRNNLALAVANVRAGKISYRKASAYYNVPKTTIQDHVSGKVEEGATPGKSAVFPLDVENQLAEKIKVICPSI